ncbi:transposase [Draconibacterium sediminis]|uniref:Transposase IS200-like domain-containing protein n=1 Tax=Draconibacterium sediminis TaxID=1544798 RepID=A0A0D8JEG4_9BACT|nr:transposase [Draconibacterium sediminis]KJF44218.1 hypothetical protein LH29_01450 [Draconibacterium sediminis]
MPSIKTKTPLLGGGYYHLFNRGINREKIFFTTPNYHYFLLLIERYLMHYMDILAYCLLPNHFHLIVKIKDEVEAGAVSESKIQPRPLLQNEEEIGKLASKQLGRLFTSYAMAINKQENGVSNLFDPKFKRLEIDQHEYLEYLIFILIIILKNMVFPIISKPISSVPIMLYPVKKRQNLIGS